MPGVSADVAIDVLAPPCCWVCCLRPRGPWWVNVLLFLDGDEVGDGRVDATAAMVFSADDTCDVGTEGGALVTNDYGRDNAFTGKVGWVQIDLDPNGDDPNSVLTVAERLRVAMARQRRPRRHRGPPGQLTPSTSVDVSWRLWCARCKPPQGSGHMIDIEGVYRISIDGRSFLTAADQDRVVVLDEDEQNAQRWEIGRSDGGQFTIRPTDTGLYLSCSDPAQPFELAGMSAQPYTWAIADAPTAGAVTIGAPGTDLTLGLSPLLIYPPMVAVSPPYEMDRGWTLTPA